MPCSSDEAGAEALKALGNAQKAAGNLEQAAQSYRRSLGINPDYLPSLYNLGLVLRELAQPDEAARCFRRLVEVDPADGDARVHLHSLQNTVGMFLQREGSFAAAEQRFRDAIELLPDDPSGHANLGCAFAAVGRFQDAASSFKKALALDADDAQTHFHLGNLQRLLGEHEMAIAYYARALDLDPGNPVFTECMLFETQSVCDWSRFDEFCIARRRDIAARPEIATSPFSLLSIPSTAEEQLQCAKSFSRGVPAAERDSRRFERGAKPKLRIGYLSADFHEHATAYLTAGLFEAHDRGRFEVLGYSYGPDDSSPMRARLKRGFDRFTDVAGLSHAQAAAAIEKDGIDVLVDLKGHTTGARPQILALRPAPLQVSYLGFPGTSGADFIDYLVADRFLIRPGEEGCYSELPVFLPRSYQVNDRARQIGSVPSRQELGLPEDGFVFCCFNLGYKILPETFDCWMRLLHAVPRSVLWLLESNRWAVGNLRREARRRGIDGTRLIFAPRVPLSTHLGRHRAADLALDTRPYNAHTTASDALWAGVPLVTWPGETFASRVAGSLLAAAGFSELIVNSVAEYEALAVSLAIDGVRLKKLRDRLAVARDESALFDTARFARDLEAAYMQMWEGLVAGCAPSAIYI